MKTSSWLDTRKTQAFLVLLALACLQFLLTLHLRMNSLPAAEPAPEKMEAYNPELFKVMSFGQTPAVIDWMWIKTLQDTLVTHVAKGTHPAIFYILDLMTDLDPAFRDAYVDGATLVSVIRDDGPGALHLLLKGEVFRRKELSHYDEDFRERYWPMEWQMPMLLGYVSLFDMDDMPGAARAFQEAEQLDGSPAYLKILIEQLSRDGGEYEVGLRLLNHMIAGTKDPLVIERLQGRLKSLRISYFVFSLNEQFSKFLRPRPSMKSRSIDGAKREKMFEKFLRIRGGSDVDPWGGRLSLRKDGKIATTTPHRAVFGLE